MKKTEEDFDKTILDNEEEFNKRFKRINRKDRPNAAINQSLREAKNRITIYLDADIVEHFKTQAENSKTGYQTLINQTLREKIDGSQNMNKADELIERLLQDKTALSRLKAELETI
jgi:uncharacterized protein (DUF4415 family)